MNEAGILAPNRLLTLLQGLLFAVCAGGALFLPPAALTSHPQLAWYSDFVASVAPSVDVFGVGALYPEVSRLVLSVAWPIAFVLWAAMLVQGIRALRMPQTKMWLLEWNKRIFERRGIILNAIYLLAACSLLISVLFTDLGVIHGFGLISGVGWGKEYAGPFGRLIYSSRLNLAIGAFAITYAAATFYSVGFIAIFVYAIPRFVSRLTQ